MTMPPLISVIIPVYRHSAELKKTLASVCGQSYAPIEIIVVDDGNYPAINISSDDSAVRVLCVRQDHAGASAARNRGFREAKGEYVIFWDADIVGEPDMLSKMHNALQQHPQASYAYSNFYFGMKAMPARVFSADTLRRVNYITSTSLIRREHFIPWDETIKKFQDWDLWLTMAADGYSGVWIPEYLFRIYPRRAGISHWLPRFAYHAPWRWWPGIRSKVKEYEAARSIIEKKHHLKPIDR